MLRCPHCGTAFTAGPHARITGCGLAAQQQQVDWFVPDSSGTSACSACGAEQRLLAPTPHLPHQPSNHVPADQGAFCLALRGRCLQFFWRVPGQVWRCLATVPGDLKLALRGRCWVFFCLSVVKQRLRLWRLAGALRSSGLGSLFRGVAEEPCSFKAIYAQIWRGVVT